MGQKNKTIFTSYENTFWDTYSQKNEIFIFLSKVNFRVHPVLKGVKLF